MRGRQANATPLRALRRRSLVRGVDCEAVWFFFPCPPPVVRSAAPPSAAVFFPRAIPYPVCVLTPSTRVFATGRPLYCRIGSSARILSVRGGRAACAVCCNHHPSLPFSSPSKLPPSLRQRIKERAAIFRHHRPLESSSLLLQQFCSSPVLRVVLQWQIPLPPQGLLSQGIDQRRVFLAALQPGRY